MSFSFRRKLISLRNIIEPLREHCRAKASIVVIPSADPITSTPCTPHPLVSAADVF